MILHDCSVWWPTSTPSRGCHLTRAGDLGKSYIFHSTDFIRVIHSTWQWTSWRPLQGCLFVFRKLTQTRILAYLNQILRLAQCIFSSELNRPFLTNVWSFLPYFRTFFPNNSSFSRTKSTFMLVLKGEIPALLKKEENILKNGMVGIG